MSFLIPPKIIPKSTSKALQIRSGFVGSPVKIKNQALFLLKEIFTFIGEIFSAPFTGKRPSFNTIMDKELEKATNVAKALPKVLENLPKDFSNDTTQNIPPGGKLLYKNNEEINPKTGQKYTPVQCYEIVCKYHTEDKKEGTPAAYEIIARNAVEEITLATIPNRTLEEERKINSSTIFGANYTNNIEHGKTCLDYYIKVLKQYVDDSKNVIKEHSEKKDTENQRNREDSYSSSSSNNSFIYTNRGEIPNPQFDLGRKNISTNNSSNAIQFVDESKLKEMLNEIGSAVDEIEKKLATFTSQDKDDLTELENDKAEIKLENKTSELDHKELERKELKSILTQNLIHNSDEEKESRAKLRSEQLKKSNEKLTTQINDLTKIVTLCKEKQDNLKLISASLIGIEKLEIKLESGETVSETVSEKVCEIEEKIKQITKKASSKLPELILTKNAYTNQINLLSQLTKKSFIPVSSTKVQTPKQ